MTHTPTPWKVYQFGGVQVGQEDTGEAICSMWGDKHEGEANAAHVVKCVNMHDELVEALKQSLELAHITEGMTGCKSYDEYVWGVQEVIRSALKKAGAL